MRATITRSYTTEVEIPDGEYCQRADGSVNCKYYYYEIDPIFGSGFISLGTRLMCPMTIFRFVRRETLKSVLLVQSFASSMKENKK